MKAVSFPKVISFYLLTVFLITGIDPSLPLRMTIEGESVIMRGTIRRHNAVLISS